MKEITEEQGIHEEWYKIAKSKEMSMESLPEFLRMLSQDYQHDYGTVCHAIAAGAIATAWAMNRARGMGGGITGFQAGAVMWEFIKHWGSVGDGPLRMTKFEDLLYPQYEEKFKTISKETWEWLQNKAKENLETISSAHPEVVAHWKSIVDGKIPFGFRLESE